MQTEGTLVTVYGCGVLATRTTHRHASHGRQVHFISSMTPSTVSTARIWQHTQHPLSRLSSLRSGRRSEDGDRLREIQFVSTYHMVTRF